MSLVNNGPITIVDTDPAGVHTSDGHLTTPVEVILEMHFQLRL